MSEQFKPGDKVTHTQVPAAQAAPLMVLEARPCNTELSDLTPHLSYLVTDPEGREDWLCGHVVRRADA